MTNPELSKLEMAVIDRILNKESEDLEYLREQVPFLQVKKRELTGYGFFTTFDLADNVRITIDITRRYPTLGTNIWAEIPGLEGGAGFMLMVEKGRIHMLEGFSSDEPWPEKVESFRLHEKE